MEPSLRCEEKRINPAKAERRPRVVRRDSIHTDESKTRHAAGCLNHGIAVQHQALKFEGGDIVQKMRVCPMVESAGVVECGG